MTAGELTMQIRTLKDQKVALDAEVKDVAAQIELLTTQLIDEMGAMGVDNIKTEAGSFTVSNEMYPRITNKIEFFKFLKAHDMPELSVLQVNKAAFKEYYQENGDYPDGCDAYMAKKLSIRKS